MIPKSNLDDRSFNDIVEEAIRLIPRYCPEWTNHNPSDPGITLVELFAWMTEMTLYRLNKVPEKTYLSLLELMGLSLVAPQAARAVIKFYPVEGYKKNVHIRSGTQVAAVTSGDASYVFETEKNITINGNRLVSCINREGESWNDFCKEGEITPFTLFSATESVEHALYLSSPDFIYLEAEHSIQVTFTGIQEIGSVRDELVNYLYWEYWNGRSWTQLRTTRSIPGRKKKDNVVYFSGPIDLRPCSVNGTESLFIRGILSEVPDNLSVLSVRDVQVRPHFGGSGFMPDLCVMNSENLYSVADMNTSFRMFSELPTYNETFYIAADEVLSRTGTHVRISFFFSEVYVPGDENENALFSYEYWDGTGWIKLSEVNSFHDGTFGFKQEGGVSFKVPDSIRPVEINNEEHLWLRIRLVTRDFSIGGEYVRDEKENWVWKFSTKVHSPVLDKIRITYDSKDSFPAHVIAYSNFHWKSLKSLCLDQDIARQSDTLLFSVHSDGAPGLYLGFMSSFPKGDSSIYVRINEEKVIKQEKSRYSFFSNGVFSETNHSRLIDILWEYWNGSNWYALAVNDYTDSFHESGFIEFMVPSDMARKNEFGKDLFWIRASLISGSFESNPEIQAVELNSVYGRNITTYKNEIAGSGTGAPGQCVIPAHGPILPGIILSVNEGSIPPAVELDAMRADGITMPYETAGEEVWVRYREVENFYSSDSFSRHYVVDYQEGKIYFGDGQRGVNPPRCKFNIRLDSYSTGGGSRGNVAAHTLRVLSRSIPFVSGCDNPFPAEGGADMETVESLKSRAAGAFKSLQRAVTMEDFQWLAREASASVGRAHCLKEKNIRGEICVIVIPVLYPGATLADRLVPSRELIRRVRDYLGDRKLVGTRINVQAPVYRSFDLMITLAVKSDVLDVERLKKQIEYSFREHFHPLAGSQGDGWEFGKDVTTGAVLKQLERIDGILSVDTAELYDVDAGVVVEKLVLKEDEIPFLRDVVLDNRRDVQ